jgi:preprotein translocase subunit SecB
MSDQSTGAGAPAAAPSAEDPAAQPGPSGTPQVPLTVLAQYLKDLSFENPRAPGVFGSATQPQNAATVTVQLHHLGERAYEVVLNMRIDATVGGEAAYVVELAYGGVFALGKVAPEMIEPLLMVEAPRLLFPFARSVAALATREGGFPQILISPIDFAALYRGHRRQQAAQAGAAAAAPAASGNA